MEESREFTWAFHRLGGMDQVTLETLEEIKHLRELDPKLWATLSCPASGLEFDARTLALLDTDGDGRIRIPEVLEAVEWLEARLVDASEIASRSDALPLASIQQGHPDGKRLYNTAVTILKNLGKEEKACVTMEDVAGAASVANSLLFNGDGIFPPHADLDEAKRTFLSSALSVVGGVKDASGAAGIDASLVDAFRAALQAEKDWRSAVKSAPRALGEATEAAWKQMLPLKEKLDDYFLRCHLAAFAPLSTSSLNADERLSHPVEHGLLEADVLAELPVSRISAEAVLRFESGLNPVWQEKLSSFFALVAPLLSDGSSLTEADWKRVQDALAPYGAVLNSRPSLASSAEIPAADASAALSSLSDEQIETLLDAELSESLKEMMASDKATPAASSDIITLERLVLYYTHLHRLLMNFVSFHDFYSLKRPAMFQAGTLFIDGRSCRLCLPVADVAKHSAMASLSQLCLLYCDCRRRVAAGSGPATMKIVAAMTAGSDTFLREGRNGVYVDNEGQDWDATLVKIVRNPISIKQAMWAPYLRISQMAAEQVAKLAGNKDAKLVSEASKKVEAAVAGQAKGMPFDISKSVGLFAAVGIALGALGTAVGSIAAMLMSLHWWQFPLLIAAAFACISGPAVFMAWLKLRKRTLGPVLEASGWAVNGQIPINLVLGAELTSEAILPRNSTRTKHDPLHQKTKTGKLILGLVMCCLLGLGYLGWNGTLTRLIDAAVQIEQPAAAPAAEGQTPPAAK